MFPKIAELGPITIHTYGLLMATSFLVATALLARLAEKDGVPRARAWDLGFVIIICALLGAKLLMVLHNFDDYWQDPSKFLSLSFWQAGGAYYGGLVGATLGSLLYLRNDPRLDFLTVADAAAPAIALGQAIGRLGCFAAGCDYGTKSELPWAVTFTDPYAGDNVGVPLGVPLHPVQLYESLGTLVLFLGLLWFRSRRRFKGQILFAYFAGYGLLRFFLEFFRGDPGRGAILDGSLSIPQAISLAVIAAGALLFWKVRPGKVSTNRG